MKYAILILALFAADPALAQQMSGPLNGTTPESRKAYVERYCKTHISAACRRRSPQEIMEGE